MNIAYLCNNIKMGVATKQKIAYCNYSKFAGKILDLLQNLNYIKNYEKENYKFKIELLPKIKHLYVIKPKIGLKADKLFKLYKNIYLGDGYLFITNSTNGLIIYNPSDKKMAGIPILYVCI